MRAGEQFYLLLFVRRFRKAAERYVMRTTNNKNPSRKKKGEEGNIHTMKLLYTWM